MAKLKTLYTLTRKKLFEKHYFCMYCELTDFDKNIINNHIISNHDECGKTMRRFKCKICQASLIENEIIRHCATYHILKKNQN